MRTFLLAVGVSAILFGFSTPTPGQGDVRSATGLPIPIGVPVIWGQVELKGLRPDEPRPMIIVYLMFNGAQIAQYQANDKGYYYFLQRPRDGSELTVRVGGNEAGRVIINSTSGDRHDMVVNWTDSAGAAQKTGTISVRDAYTGRTPANRKLYESASVAVKAGKPDEAIRIFSEIVAADPQDFVAWTELGSIYFGRNKHSDAERSYTKALQLKPDFMPALMNLGKLHMAKKNFGEAVVVLEKAVTSEPTSVEALHYLGESYLQNKQGSKAVVVLNQALQLAPIEKAEIHLRLAALYNAAGLKDRAAAEYKMFLRKVPNHPEKTTLEKYVKENSK